MMQTQNFASQMLSALMCFLVLAERLAAAVQQPPHIVSVMVDDLGSYNTQVNNPNAPGDTIGALTKEGIKLEVHNQYFLSQCVKLKYA